MAHYKRTFTLARAVFLDEGGFERAKLIRFIDTVHSECEAKEPNHAASFSLLRCETINHPCLEFSGAICWRTTITYTRLR